MTFEEWWSSYKSSEFVDEAILKDAFEAGYCKGLEEGYNVCLKEKSK